MSPDTVHFGADGKPEGAPKGFMDGECFVQRFAIAYDYPVYFTHGVFESGNAALEAAISRREPGRRHKLVALVDAGVAARWPALAADIERYVGARAERLQLVHPPIVVAGGEPSKNDPSLVESLQRTLVDMRMDRHSVVVAVGGGAFLDLVGFVAATTHRGIRLVRVPTTVLAQNDSGIGVKNGVNAFGMKNLLGTFAPPFAVLNDLQFVLTLEDRDKIAGIAEAVKVALIRDAAFFDWLEENADALRACETTAMAYMIRRCAELHMHQIAHGGDPFESGSVRPLDFGHWSAHKLETLSAHALRHGEAVAIGMALDIRYALEAGLLAQADAERVVALLRRLGFALWHPALTTRNGRGELVLLDGLEEFREHLGGELTITLVTSIGIGEEVHHMHRDTLLRALGWLECRGAA